MDKNAEELKGFRVFCYSAICLSIFLLILIIIFLVHYPAMIPPAMFLAFVVFLFDRRHSRFEKKSELLKEKLLQEIKED